MDAVSAHRLRQSHIHLDSLHMSAATKVLDRLEGVRQSGEGRWMAKCPAHPDKRASLSIREMPDGRVLINDFGGCPTQRVLQAIGLDFGDLFEAPLAHYLPPVRSGYSARELLELNAHETLVAAMLASKAADQGLTPEEAQRLRKAAARLSAGRA
jgi:hypothetical protein